MVTKRNSLSDTRRESFYTELHALLTAGLDFSQAFRLLIDGERDARIKALLKQLYGNVVDGAALWQAMERSEAFRSLECGVIRIGDETGRLAETLEFLGDYFRKRSVQRRMISSSASYPLVILCTAVAVVAFMLAVVVPMFEEVYARMGGELPALTRWIISVSQAFPAYAAGTIAAFCGIGTIYYANRNKKEVRRWLSNMLLHLPVAGTIIRKNHEAQFCRLLHLLSSSGVPLLTGVKVLSDVIGFYPYRQSFELIAQELECGGTFAEGISRFPELYDRRLAALVRVGEETGRLPEMLHRRADALAAELEYAIRRVGTLLEPLLILLVGILVAVILVAMYMPMFSLGGIMG